MDSRFEFLDLDALLSKSYSELTEVELAFLGSEGINEKVFHQMQEVHAAAAVETEVPPVSEFVSASLMEQFAEHNPTYTGVATTKKEKKKKTIWLYWSGAAVAAAVMVFSFMNIDFGHQNNPVTAQHQEEVKEPNKETKTAEKPEGKTDEIVKSLEGTVVKEEVSDKITSTLVNNQHSDKKTTETQALAKFSDESKERFSNGTDSGLGSSANSGIQYTFSSPASGDISFSGTEEKSDIHDDAAGMNLNTTSTLSNDYSPLRSVGNVSTNYSSMYTESVPRKSYEELSTKDLESPSQDPMLDVLHTAW